MRTLLAPTVVLCVAGACASPQIPAGAAQRPSQAAAACCEPGCCDGGDCCAAPAANSTTCCAPAPRPSGS